MTAFEWNSFEPAIMGLLHVNALRRSRLLPMLPPLVKREGTTRAIPVFEKPHRQRMPDGFAN